MNQNKLSQYFFIIAAVIAILDGAFELDATMQSLKFVILVFSGIVVGALRHYEQKEFLLSGVAVIITGFILTEVLSGTISNFSIMIYNFIIFLSAATVVVGIEQIANIITFDRKEEEHEEHERHVEAFKKMSPHEIKHATFERIWGVIILIAVALTFIVLLAQSFFDVSAFGETLLIVEALITILFIIDLVILYEKAGNFSKFVNNNIFDIIAAIPTVGVLRGLKLIRAVRIVRFMSKSVRVTKMTKLYKTTKFFSEESAFNNVENQNQRTEKKTRTKPASKSHVKTVSVKKKPIRKTTTRKTSAKKTTKKAVTKKTTSKKTTAKKTSTRKKTPAKKAGKKSSGTLKRKGSVKKTTRRKR